MTSSIKPVGWYSRRRQTSEAYEEYRAALDQKETEQYAWAQERTVEAAKRTPQEQLKRLDAKFGKGNGAKRERLRLCGLLIAAAEAAKAKAKKADK